MSHLKPKTQPETHIRRQVRDYLRVKGYFTWRNAQSAISEKGIPDLMAVRLTKRAEFKQIIEKALSGEVVRQDMLLDRIYDVLEGEGLMCMFEAWEIKTATGKISEHQERFIAELKAQGCRRAGVARRYEDVE